MHHANRNIKLFLYKVARNITGVMTTIKIDSNTFPWNVIATVQCSLKIFEATTKQILAYILG